MHCVLSPRGDLLQFEQGPEKQTPSANLCSCVEPEGKQGKVDSRLSNCLLLKTTPTCNNSSSPMQHRCRSPASHLGEGSLLALDGTGVVPMEPCRSHERLRRNNLKCCARSRSPASSEACAHPPANRNTPTERHVDRGHVRNMPGRVMHDGRRGLQTCLKAGSQALTSGADGGCSVGATQFYMQALQAGPPHLPPPTLSFCTGSSIFSAQRMPCLHPANTVITHSHAPTMHSYTHTARCMH